MRAIHAVRDLDDGRSKPISVIALATSGELGAPFARDADEVVDIGPPMFVDPRDGLVKNSYLNHGALERALVASRADAAWVGWGFVAEDPSFVDLCDRIGVVFVGPDAATMRLVGDKIASKRMAAELGVPVASWSGRPVETLEAAVVAAEAIAYPLMVKATAGGGGRGIRRVERAEALPAAFASARAEADGAFGDPTVFLERVIAPARHVEVQVIGDGHGTAWAVGVRDCSVQRRHQKVIEESACPVFTDDQEASICRAAARLAESCGYCGAATVEFLYQPETGELSFMEVNAQLQVEHPVTEMTTGLDLVGLQLHVAAGGRLTGDPPAPRGHAIEVRLNAEDPARDFLPTPGRLTELRLPNGPGIRVDTGVREGDTIPVEFDSMIAKIIAWGSDRDEALRRLHRALADTVVVIDGGTTNRGFLLELLAHDDVRRGATDDTWLDRHQAVARLGTSGRADVALVQAAIEIADAEDRIDRDRFYSWARRGRPRCRDGVGREINLRHRGEAYRVGLWRLGPDRWRVALDGEKVEAAVERASPHEARLTLGGVRYRTVSSRQGTELLIEVEGVAHRFGSDDGGLIRAPAPAVVVALRVEVGDRIELGDPVAVLESMKMETVLTAPLRGRVQEILTGTNVQVDAGAPLIRIDTDDAAFSAGDDRERTRARIDLVGLHASPAPTQRDDERLLDQLLLGYDVPDADVARITTLAGEGGPHAEGRRCRDADVISWFADLRSLTTRSRPAIGDATVRSADDHFNDYLRSLDQEAEGLPAPFVAQLGRLVARYGCAGLGPSPAVSEAMYRLFRSMRRGDAQRRVVLAILSRLMDQSSPDAGARDEGSAGMARLIDALDALVRAADPLDPVMADRARLARRRYVDQPILDRVRLEAALDASALLDTAISHADSGSRNDHIAALVAFPQPLASLITRRLRNADPSARSLLVEVMTRRYYGRRLLEHLERTDRSSIPWWTAGYVHDNERYVVAATDVDLDDLPTAVEAISTWPHEPADRVLVDLYVEHPGALSRARIATRVRHALDAVTLPASVERVVVAATLPDADQPTSGVELFTFRPGADGVVEDARYGLHPAMAERLELWRLENFDLVRLDTVEDVYLYSGTARDNPNDRRLFAAAEVRSLDSVVDQGRVVALPELERMAEEALDAIRRLQADLPSAERTLSNRVLLYLWPPFDIDLSDLRSVIVRLARGTEALGIEAFVVRCRRPTGPRGTLRDRVIEFSNPTGRALVVEEDDPPTEPLPPLDEYTRKVISARRRGMVSPYELAHLLAPSTAGGSIPPGRFVEHDLVDDHLEAVERPFGLNTAGIVVGTVTSFTERYPEGMRRVALFGDPLRALGSIAEPECRRIIAALDLAEQSGLPVDWFALSAGARIAMDSGTENMDWVAAVLRRIIQFTQAGGELNVVVAGINVGAQPYWNAEATMLMHTKGILVMTPDSAMVLTGKQALEYSGAVSAEDNAGIGGYERIMGPNGQAQYWAPDLAAACEVLVAHHEHGYVATGERFPRRAHTSDPFDRDVGPEPHHGEEFECIAEVFSPITNPDRKRSFDIRSLMAAVVDHDHDTLERWSAMAQAGTGVVWDAHLGGWPVTLIGIESRPLPRTGPIPADGPDRWTSGTLFPESSKKIARAVNATSGRRPLVVLANLSGFDGSPESLRRRQLEYGAEIGRAIVNFDGPVVFCVVSRFHGGAFVVFSRRLNAELVSLAVEGSRASVIGGGPAAAVVFAHEVDVRTRQDPAVAQLAARAAAAPAAERERLRAELADVTDAVRADKRGELAAEFDAIHSVERALRVGSIDEIISADRLRPALIGAVEAGVRRTLERVGLDR